VEPGLWQIEGEVAMQGIPDTFRAVVPLYLDMGKDTFIRLGQVPLVGTTPYLVKTKVRVPQAPKRVLANVFCDLLTRD